MSFYHNPKIVTNGLVFYHDYQNPKGRNANDLSGNGWNGTVTTGSTYDTTEEAMYCNADGGIETQYIEQLTDFTVEVWFKPTTTRTQYGRLVDKNYQGGFFLGRNSNIANSFGGGIKEGSSPYGIYGTYNENEWNCMFSIRSGTDHLLYKNGAILQDQNIITGDALDATAVTIGDRPDYGTQFLSGYIRIVKIYNIALTVNDMKQNFIAHRGRFGL